MTCSKSGDSAINISDCATTVRLERRADVGSKERYAALSLYNLRKVMNHTIGSEIR